MNKEKRLRVRKERREFIENLEDEIDNLAERLYPLDELDTIDPEYFKIRDLRKN